MTKPMSTVLTGKKDQLNFYSEILDHRFNVRKSKTVYMAW